MFLYRTYLFCFKQNKSYCGLYLGIVAFFGNPCGCARLHHRFAPSRKINQSQNNVYPARLRLVVVGFWGLSHQPQTTVAYFDTSSASHAIRQNRNLHRRGSRLRFGGHGVANHCSSPERGINRRSGGIKWG